MYRVESGPTEIEPTHPTLSPARSFERFLDALENACLLSESHNGLWTELILADERLVVQELEHAVLLRVASYAIATSSAEPQVEMLFYLDNHLACYPIALRGVSVGRLTRVPSQQALAHFANGWAEGLVRQGWERYGRIQGAPQPDALLPPESALSAHEKARLAEWLQPLACEATDSCPVGLYSRCRHGCPSWFVALSLV